MRDRGEHVGLRPVTRELLHAGGIFKQIHDELAGNTFDFGAFDASPYPAELLEYARQVWGYRVVTEYRSIQAMTRFLAEVLGAGDPLEVYAGAADAIMDEIRHTALCAGMVEALGGQPLLPEPIADEENPEFLALPMAQRALATGISLLAISETLSVGFIRDLHERCTNPVVSAILGTTLADEDTHHEFGWTYVEQSLARFDADGMVFWRQVTKTTLQPHLETSAAALADVPLHRRHLDAWPEPRLAELGLLSPQREALIFERTYQLEVAPRLQTLGLLG